MIRIALFLAAIFTLLINSSDAIATQFNAFARAGLSADVQDLDAVRAGDVVNIKVHIAPYADLDRIEFTVIETINVTLQQDVRHLTFTNVRKGDPVTIDVPVLVERVPAEITVQYTTHTGKRKGWDQLIIPFGRAK